MPPEEARTQHHLRCLAGTAVVGETKRKEYAVLAPAEDGSTSGACLSPTKKWLKRGKTARRDPGAVTDVRPSP